MNNHDFTDAFMAMVREVFSTNQFIPLHAPRFMGCEKELILKTIESTFVSSVGECVEQFEEDIAQYTGAQFAIAVSSGTAALHTALHAVGVVRNDEVITSPLTFVATCNAISYCGARPVFVDVDLDTLSLSPKSLAQFLDQHAELQADGLCWNRSSGKVIRACVPVHNLGHPARAKEIAAACERYNIAVIEDAAESLGSLSDEQHTGRVGLIGILSFNGNKIITTGGGGALITDDAALARRLKHLTTTAKQPHPWLFRHDEIGFNYRLPNLNAALGVAQMAQLDDFVAKKRKLAKYYATWLDQWPQATIVSEPTGARSNYWLNAMLLQDCETRDSFLCRTNEQGIMTRPMWTPMHTLPMYQNCQRSSLDNAELIENTLVNIPSSVVSVQ